MTLFDVEPVSLPNLRNDFDLPGFFQELRDQGNTETDNKGSWYNHTFFTFDQVTRNLLLCPLVIKFAIPNELLDIISKFVGITSWSLADKSNQINIYQSKDTQIQYALLHETQNVGSKNNQNKFHTIFLNEWIGTDMDYVNEKYVFRYIFKYFASRKNNSGNSRIFSRLFVGFITCDGHIDSKKLFEDYNVCIGQNDIRSSVAWLCTTSNVCRFQTSSSKTKYFKTQLMELKGKNTYFMIEIDLDRKQFKVINSAFGSYMCKNDGKSALHVYPIPSYIMHNTPFRVGFSVQTEQSNYVGLGLVNPYK